MRAGLAVAGIAVLLAGCSPDAAEPTTSATGESSPVVSASAATAPASRVVRYTSLEDCPVTRQSREEMPFTETLCEGPAGWRLRISDSDARQSMTVVAPGGRETSLNTSAIGGGGFSSFGAAAEWRAPAGAQFRPDALIVRYQVAEQPHPAPETPYLLVVRLQPTPCITARVPPGTRQNEQAREAADGSGACLVDEREAR